MLGLTALQLIFPLSVKMLLYLGKQYKTTLPPYTV